MIKITRPRTVPRYFKSKSLQASFKLMADFYSRPLSKRIQQRFEFPTQFYPALKKDLEEVFHSKCAYCEQSVTLKEANVETFRPRRSAKNLGGKESDDHYWWLHGEWNNYYYSCSECNRFKSNWFPVQGRRAPIRASYKEVIKENYLLLDPCHDHPHLHLTYKKDGSVMPLTKRGETTIEILKLNRSDLKKRRTEQWTITWELLNEIEKDFFRLRTQKIKIYLKNKLAFLKQALEDNSITVFAATVRSAIVDYCTRNIEEGEVLIKELKAEKFKSSFFSYLQRAHDVAKYEKPQRKGARRQNQPSTRSALKPFQIQVIIDRIEIKNFRAIEDLVLKFPRVDKESKNAKQKIKIIQEPWLMLLGENGVGKSSILQAIALVLMGKAYLSRLKICANDVLKNGTKEGYVQIFQHGSGDPFFIRYSDKNKKIDTNVSISSLDLLGYGSTRLFPTAKHRPETASGKVRVKNLFDPHVPLTDPDKWLVQQYKTAERDSKSKLQYGRISRAVKDLLLLGNEEYLDVRNGKAVLINADGSERKLTVLSEGYRSVLSVVVDMMHAINKVDTTMETAQGLVLLDEIGTHLHPRWRMQVVKQFRKVFPKMQFIVTTHDPLCLRGLEKGEVMVLQKTPEEKVFALEDLPDPSGMNAEQILGSEYFGLNSTLEPEVEEKINRYYYLISKATLSSAEKKELSLLKPYVKRKNKVGNTIYEQRRHEILQKEIAMIKFAEPKRKIEFEQETLDKIKSIWKPA
jgi:uncharacterized protein (TIGR02646 family)